MTRLANSAAAAVLAISIGGCSDYSKNEAAYDQDNAAYAEGNYSQEGGNYAGNAGGNYSGTQTAAANWPSGSRIVVENGVTYRVEPGGTRVTLGPEDSRIVVENGVRYRVDPGGARVRIDPSGAAITVETPTVNATTNTQ
ncbi:MAG: hypothetical protein ACJ8D5_02240 [Sphingomicrobium sp.]